jgi:hypothetical protein
MRIKQTQLVIAVMSAAVIGAGAIGAWALWPSSPAQTGALSTPTVSASPSLSPPASAASSPSPTPSPALAPVVSVSPTKAPVKPKPSPKPPQSPVPVPPAPPKEPESCAPTYEGTNVPREQVGAALDAAAARRFWTVSQVTLPVNVIKAVAEQESGWQSAIVSCVGAVGAMQVLPATADWMNGRFGTAFNVRDVPGNAMLGSAYLQWLIKYFGDSYFGGDYALRAADCSQDPATPDHREWCLLNAVLSAYNVGHGTVDRSATDEAPGFYVNHAYIENVRALMSRW